MAEEKTVEEKLEDEMAEEEAEETSEKPKKQSKKKKKSENEVELDWDMDPTERLKVEMEALQENDQMRLVAKMLIEEFAKDPNLAAAYKERKVTLEAIIKYIMAEAQKAAVNNRAMIEDKTVYGWAIHFVQDGEVKKTDAKKLSVAVLPKKTEEEIAEQAKKDFYEAEMKRLAEEKRKAEEAAKKEAERQAKKEAARLQREQERAAKKKAEEEAKKREREYEQISLFSFFEGVEGGEA